MIGGIAYPRRMKGATAAGSGGFDAAFPASNVLSIDQPRRVAKADGTGQRAFNIDLPEARSVRAVSLVHHNISEGTEVYVALWGSLPVDGAINPGGYLNGITANVPARIGLLPQTMPFVFPQAYMARGVYVQVGGFGKRLELGGIDVSDWWAWPDIKVDEERGMLPASLQSERPGGVTETTRQWAPRIQNGTRGLLTRDQIETSVVDFQMDTGRSKTFVFVRDILDPSTWTREAYLARNNALPASVIGEGDSGLMGFNLIEHLG